MSTDLKHFKIIKVFFHSTLLGLDVKNAFFDQNELVYDEKCISVNINMNLSRHRRMSKCCLRVTNSFIEFHVNPEPVEVEHKPFFEKRPWLLILLNKFNFSRFYIATLADGPN